MRETFTSGSTRGEWAAHTGSPSLLLYRLASCHNILKVLLPIYELQSRAKDAQLCYPSFISMTNPRSTQKTK